MLTAESATQLSPEQEILSRLDRYFFESIHHPITQSFLKEASLNCQYYEGGQWTAAEIAELDKRGQAPSVENEIKPIVDRLEGQAVRQRTTVKFIGRNLGADETISQKTTATIRFIDQQNQLEFVEADMAHDGFTTGRGVLELSVDRGDDGKPRIRETHEDTFTIFPDPYSRAYDWNEDAKYICRAKWMDLDEAQALYPDAKDKLNDIAKTGYTPGWWSHINVDPVILQTRMQLYVNPDRLQVRPVEVWYKQKEKQTWLMTPQGSIDVSTLTDAQRKELDSTKLISRERNQMYLGVFCAGVLLQHAKSRYAHGRFPFVGYFAGRKKDGEPYGPVTNLRSPQDEINHRRSRGLHMLNNRQSIFERTAVQDKSKLAEELAKPDGQIELEDGAMERKRFVLQPNQDIGQANIGLMGESKLSMRRISGEDYMDGSHGEIRSGAGMREVRQSYTLTNTTMMNNFRRTRRLSMRLKFELMKQYFTEDMQFQIHDAPNVTTDVAVSAAEFDAIRERIYDLIMEDTTDVQTTRQEQRESLRQQLPGMVQYGPAWASILLDLTDLPEKEGIQKKLTQLSAAPPPPPKVTMSVNYSELSPLEKAAFAQQMGMPELAQAAMQGQVQPPIHESKQKTDLMKTQMKTDTQIILHSDKMRGDLKKHRMDTAMTKQELAQDQVAQTMPQSGAA